MTIFHLKCNETVSVIRDSSEMPLIDIALDLLKRDLSQVLGADLEIAATHSGREQIIVGTLESPLLKPWFENGTLSKEQLSAHPEAFQLAVVGSKLLIAGADRRGAAYGIMELSRKLGVSPWEWWADAIPAKLDGFSLSAAYNDIQWPDVEFRGIFINDEDIGFVPWAAKFEPETKDVIGPKTYSKVFELLIRLRANTLWPAMHACSMPFFLVEGNAEAADRYGILVGTSHCEPMNCNANGEWACRGQGEYNYATNRDSVLNFWRERLKKIGKSDNLYTIGMRGIHDGPMNGAANDQECRNFLTRVFADQRALLAEYSGKPADQVPQVFIPYKEVFDVYRSGLEVPPDVSLMWCDDNYGYVLRLPNESDRQRPGGSGIYYHLSYWGTPFSYVWLSTNHPGQIFRELKRSYENNARRMWIINVGDIKPTEYQLALTMDMAWNIDAVGEQGVFGHLRNWLDTVFGNDVASELAECMMEFYRLAWIRKPESIDSRIWCWRREAHAPKAYIPETNDFTETEVLQRLEEYAALEKQITQIKEKIRPKLADAWFELIEYPVCAAAAVNRKYYYGEMAKYGKMPWRASHAAYEHILALTKSYNALPKWNGMMGLTDPRWGSFNEYTKEISCPKEQIFQPESSQTIIEFQGMDSLTDLEGAYGLGYKAKAAILPVRRKATFPVVGKDLKIRIAMIPTHPADGDQLRYRVLLNGRELAVINIYAKDRTVDWCWNVVRNQTVAELALEAADGILEIEALDEELLLDCIQILKTQEIYQSHTS